jgi:YHS domain-containing protein
MTLTRRLFLTTSIAALPVAISFPAYAAKPMVFTGGDFAIRGYDPVAYFTDGEPVKGLPEHSYNWNGATWLFASAASMKMFADNPDAFAPQYGGYCAYAVSKGSTAKTEPDAWTIVNNKLYLNFSLNVRTLWRLDIPENIANADANWPSVLG